jgi:ProP effector
LKNAIQAWCKSQRYWSVVLEGANRIDLDGNPAGTVDTSGALQTRSLLKKHQKRSTASKKPSLEPQSN